MHESIRRAFERGGKLALLGDLYMRSETFRFTNWQDAIRHPEPINGSHVYYSPLPFIINEEILTQDPQETAVVQLFMGLIGYETTNPVGSPFTQDQIDDFSKLMLGLDEYLEQNELRGSLAILRAVNVDDLSGEEHMFTGVVDDWNIDYTDNPGLTLEIADPIDVIPAASYPNGPMCPFKFGDDRCGINADSSANKYEGTVGVGSSTTAIVDTSISPSTSGYWNVAIITIESGQNKGISRLVKSYDSGTDTITPNIPFEHTINEGDTFTLRRRCKKTVDFCRDTFNNFSNGGLRHGGYAYENQPVQGLFWRGKQ